MSKILAIIGGKAKGIADQVTIDLALGCKNQCVGCYAKKSCQRGRHYDTVIYKDLDKALLKKSIRLAQAKGFQLARVGKHCDPGEHIDSLDGVLDCCNDEHFRCVVVSKSLVYSNTIADKLKAGDHVLHISLGPPSSIARPEEARVATAMDYKDNGVRTVIRLTRDVTQSMTAFDAYVASVFNYIVTPMRYASREIAAQYNTDLVNFEFVSGYYRPRMTHSSWIPYMINVCGEINNELKCCSCLVNI